ncbi:hypothetical protein, partial [Lyngbya sp. CCY1209]|uniref:hypothetical protein n=1 Tax=Lyngbya sp. CCY1209 TaxID=2886103 RepID=UPI002D209B32
SNPYRKAVSVSDSLIPTAEDRAQRYTRRTSETCQSLQPTPVSRAGNDTIAHLSTQKKPEISGFNPLNF